MVREVDQEAEADREVEVALEEVGDGVVDVDSRWKASERDTQRFCLEMKGGGLMIWNAISTARLMLSVK